MRPLFLLDAMRGLGVGQQVLVAASAGFVVWYLYRAMGIGRTIGGFIGSVTRYAMAVGTFTAISIAFGWLDPFTMLGDLNAGAGALWGLLDEYAKAGLSWAIEKLMGGVG